MATIKTRRAAKPARTAADDIALPKGVQVGDLKYPSWKSKQRVEHTLTMHYVVSGRIDSGWFIANLHIGKGRGFANRTYATRVADGKTGFRIGRGPHVTKTITVYVTGKAKTRLAPLVAMAGKGEVDANVIRDRISSRRAQGALNRAAGMSSWRW